VTLTRNLNAPPQTADNGGPVFGQGSGCTVCDGSAGANNYPLRGGKHSNWEGGIRANALVSGGLIPPALRGTTLTGLMAIEDWYKTFGGLGGADTSDERAARAGLPPVEGFDMWPYISGAVPDSPRSEVWIGADTPTGGADSAAFVQGLLRADGYKILHDVLYMNIWQGPVCEFAARVEPRRPLDSNLKRLPAQTRTRRRRPTAAGRTSPLTAAR
jgi:hypothetical protein